MVDYAKDNGVKSHSSGDLDLLLEKAIDIANKAHRGQLDKGGNPYILHPKSVADSVDSVECKIVAYLHDVCEDSSITPEELLAEGFGHNIVHAVWLLTRMNGVSYKEYLKVIKTNDIARVVKIADLKHNMDMSRIPNPTEADYKRVERYRKALRYLQG